MASGYCVECRRAVPLETINPLTPPVWFCDEEIPANCGIGVCNRCVKRDHSVDEPYCEWVDLQGAKLEVCGLDESMVKMAVSKLLSEVV